MRKNYLLGLVAIILVISLPAAAREPIHFESDTLKEKKQILHAKGNVKFRQGQYQICSQSADYNRSTGDLFFRDDIEINIPEGEFSSQAIDYNVQTSKGSINNFRGTLNQSQLRLYGKQLHLTPETFFLSSANITSCPTKDVDWLVKQSEATVHRAAQEVELTNAILYWGSVPLVYLPYWRFYYGEDPKTGFISPDITIKSGRIGGSAPYYIRLADNIDFTIIPNYDTEYGLELGNQLRFLTEDVKGEIALNHVFFEDEERGYQSIDLKSNETATYKNSPWKWWLTGSNVSDHNYLRNFGDSTQETSKRNLPRIFGFAYTDQLWGVTMEAKTYKTIDDNLITPSQILPQITYNYADDNWQHRFHYSRFINTDANIPNTNRLLWNSELSHTYYIDKLNFQPSLGINSGYHMIDKKDNEFVLVPHVQLRANYLQNFSQTDSSEHQILWRTALMYAPHVQQDNIFAHTTQNLASSLSNIYEWNRFIGGDRYGDISALTYGFEHRFFDDDRERFFLALGQRYYFVRPRTLLPGQRRPNSGADNIFIETYFNIDDRWQLASDAEFNIQNGTTERFYFDLNWRASNKKRFNVGYLSDESESFVTGFATPLFKRVEGSFNIDYSLSDSQISQSQLSINIEDDCACWTLHLGITNRVVGINDRDTKFSIGMVFTGLTSVGRQYNSDLESVE